MVRSLIRSAVCLGASLLLLSPASSAAPPTWRLLDSPRYRLLSQLSEKATRTWADEFNRFLDELARVHPVAADHLAPLSVVIFAREADFAPFKPIGSAGEPLAHVAGVFRTIESWSVIAFAGDRPKDETRHIIQHEGVHWFRSANPRPLPVWLDEGLAEVFATFRAAGKTAHWGEPVESYVRTLRDQDLIPLARFLAVTRDDPLFHEWSRKNIFYAQSWALVHYLLHERQLEPGELQPWVESLNHGTAIGLAGDAGTLEHELAAYASHQRFRSSSRPLTASAAVSDATVAAPLALVEGTLARLAYGSNYTRKAEDHAHRAIAVDPQHPLGHEMAALIAYRRHDFSHALAKGRTALELGSHDARTHFIVAHMETEAATSAGTLTPKLARRVADLYLESVRLQPGFEQGYVNLAGVIDSLEELRPGDKGALVVGAAQFPEAGEILVGLAQIAYREGDRATARDLFNRAQTLHLSPAGVVHARHLQERWIYADAMAHIDAMVHAEQFAEAIIAHDELSGKITRAEIQNQLARGRRDLAARHKLRQAEDALRAGRRDEAQTLLRELTAATAIVPLSVREAAIRNLRRLADE